MSKWMEPRMSSLEETEGMHFQSRGLSPAGSASKWHTAIWSVGGGELCLRNLCAPPNCLLRERVILRHNGQGHSLLASSLSLEMSSVEERIILQTWIWNWKVAWEASKDGLAYLKSSPPRSASQEGKTFRSESWGNMGEIMVSNT